MKIKYNIRPPTDWTKVKIGDRIIVYEGWNVEEDDIYYGMEGIITRFNTDHLIDNEPHFEVVYSTETCYIYPQPYRNKKVLCKILN